MDLLETAISNSSSDSIEEALPYKFDVSTARFWVHYGLVIAGFVLAFITFFTQLKEPAPWGKHATPGQLKPGWGPLVPQRIGHATSDGLCCVVFFLLIFFLYGTHRAYTSYVFLGLWLSHYIHRGLIHPFIMRYSSKTVQFGIVAGTIAPNLLFSFINSDWISSAEYADKYYRDPRFIIGIVLFVIGYIINRHSDFKLRNLRRNDGKSTPLNQSSSQQYVLPRGGMFEFVTCPNYLGEMVEWLGWAIATWSLAGLAWFMFCTATFLPRARHNHQWYREQFENYPEQRKALIPFLV